MDGIERAIATTGVDRLRHRRRLDVPGAPQGAPARATTARRIPRRSRAGQLAMLLDHLFDEGFMMINTCSATLSTAMGEAEIDALVAAMERGFRKLASG